VKLASIGALLGFAVIATAAPKLRLATAAVGPVYIATGQDGTLRSIPATNIGDGALNLSVTSNVDWLVPCIENEGQLLVNLMLFTSKLPRGSYTGVATVTDPNAIDAPQSITVTIVVGSGSTIPDQLDFYLPPGGGGVAILYAGCPSTVVTNPGSGLQISVATAPGLNGTFAAGVPCADKDSQVIVSSPPSIPLGNYEGSVAFSGSPLAADNRTVPVNIHVSTNPVASVDPTAVFFRMAQADPKMTQTISIYGNNLAISSATTDVPWLTASFFPASPWVITTVQPVSLVADASKLAPGNYPANVTIKSNAANGPTFIPVVLTVLPPGPPVASYQGVVENALYQANDPVAPGGIVALFGERLTAGNVTFTPSLPLSTTLGGASVFVNDVPAPVYFASPSQLNFVVPYGTLPGPAMARVDRDGQRGNSVSFQVVSTAPRLLRVDGANDALAVLSDLSTFVLPAHPAKAGVDIVVFYALGLGQTLPPPPPDGNAAQGLKQVNSVEAVIGFPIQPAYSGLTPGSVGLYQINVPLPANVPKGSAVPVYLTMPGGVTSNTVNIAIQ
jgi:uncharacterized protein (TIGR03437 family)